MPLVESRDGSRVIRLEFSPTRDVHDPDWTGVAFLDSATSVLRRLEFSLTGLSNNNLPRRLEGYTTFALPSPFMVIPDTTVAIWWRRDPQSSDDWGDPDVGQMLYVRSITWRKATPPQNQSSVVRPQ